MPRTPKPGLVAALCAACLLACAQAAWAMDTAALYTQIKGSVVSVFEQHGSWGRSLVGSGFAVGDGTLVATNNHVVDSGKPFIVETLDGRQIKAIKVLGYSQADDLAILQIPEALPPLALFPGKIRVGIPVVVLGNPQGYKGTLARGVVSGLRSYPNWRVKDVIQTTAPISPGSSGSPLMDEQGRVLGVIFSGYDDETHLNFAVPVDKLRKLMGQDQQAGAGQGQSPPPGSTGGLEVRQGQDGAITIIQPRKRQ